MMKRTIPLIAAVALSTASAVSVADGHSAKGFYLFGSAGQSDIDTGISSGGGISTDEEDSYFNIGAGYQLNKNFSVEAGYLDLGEASLSTDGAISGTLYGSNFTIDGKLSTQIDGLFFGLKGQVDVTKNLSLFAKAGLFSWDAEGTFTGDLTLGGLSFSGSESADLDDGTDPFFTFGTAYSITDALSADIQFSRYMLDIGGDDVDVDTVGLGLSYSFL